MNKRVKINFFILLMLLFIDSLGNGISNIILPQMITKNNLNSSIFGIVIGIQSFIGFFILLPQATFIQKKGEMKCIRYGVIANMIVYALYWIGVQFSICFGKFIEGFADRLLNSSLSKLVYDYTDDTNSRGRYRAILDIIGNVGSLSGPIVISIFSFMNIHIIFPILLFIMFIGLLMSFVFFKEDSSNHSDKFITTQNDKKIIDSLFINHLKKYLDNKKIIYLTVPSALFSCFDIFGSLILGLFLLQLKGLTSKEYTLLFTVITFITLLLQYPLGFLSDKNRGVLLTTSLIFSIFGGYGLIVTSSKLLAYVSTICIYISALSFTASMSVLFGDLTTKENRLSESEVYRTIRLIASGLFSVVLTLIYDIYPNYCMIIIFIMLIMAIIFLAIIDKRNIK